MLSTLTGINLSHSAETAKVKPKEQFTSLARLINEELLEICHHEMDKRKASGVDRVRYRCGWKCSSWVKLTGRNIFSEPVAIAAAKSLKQFLRQVDSQSPIPIKLFAPDSRVLFDPGVFTPKKSLFVYNQISNYLSLSQSYRSRSGYS